MKKFLAILGAVSALVFMYLDQAMAYVFTSTGITIESADVSDVSGKAMNAVGSQFEILKFLGLFLLVGVAGWILSKILGIKIGGGTNS